MQAGAQTSPKQGGFYRVPVPRSAGCCSRRWPLGPTEVTGTQGRPPQLGGASPQAARFWNRGFRGVGSNSAPTTPPEHLLGVYILAPHPDRIRNSGGDNPCGFAGDSGAMVTSPDAHLKSPVLGLLTEQVNQALRGMGEGQLGERVFFEAPPVILGCCRG